MVLYFSLRVWLRCQLNIGSGSVFFCVKPGFIYRVSQHRTRMREVDLLDGFQKAHNLRSMIGIFHRGSVSLI